MFACSRIGVLLILGFQYTILSSQLLTDRYEIIPFRETASGAQSIIHSLVEDPQGYIWIGTQDGIYRYDGFAFTAFEPPGDPHGQHGLQIMKMQIIKDYLYAASTRGLHLVHLPTLIIKTANLGDAGTNNSPNDLVFDIQEDHSGTIWLITPSALLSIRYPDQKSGSNPLPDSLVSTGRTLSTRSRITCLQNDEIWIEMSPYNRRDLTLTFNRTTGVFDVLDLVPSNSEDHILQLDPSNICYVGLPEHPTIATINSKDGYLQPIEIPAGFLGDYPVVAALPLNAETIQLTVRGKKWFFDLRSGKLVNPGLPIYLEDPLTDVQLRYNLYRTVDGTTIGFCSEGLIRFIDEDKVFKPFHQLDELFTLQGNSLSQIWSSDSITWACHYGDGGILLNADGTFLRHVYLGDPRPFEMPNYWWNISHHSKDTFWMGTSGGLFWYTLSGHQQGRVSRPELPDGLLTKGILTQFIDSRGEIWMGIGGGNGAVRWSKDRKTTKYYPVRSGGLPFRYPKVIAEDSRGDLWMGCQTGGGLVRWDHQQDTFEVIKADADSIFANDLIESITIDEKDRIYFGSLGGGLYEFDPQNRIFQNWSAQDGLSNNYVEDLEWDQYGHLWIATRNGLNKLDRSTDQISVFYTIHGLPSNQIGFIQKQTDSTFYILTAAGTRVFNPDELFTNPLLRPVRISRLAVNGVVMNELLQQESNHRLNYHQNNLTFEISQANIKDGMFNQYQYRFIDRHPNNWEPLNAGNQLVLLGLSPGSYPFQFRVCNNNQCRSTEVIEFRILPPFWRSIWFFLLLIILLSSIILGYTRLRIRNLIRQQNLRNQISADLHDDIGSSLSSIRFMTEMMTPDPKDPVQEQRLEAIKEEIGQSIRIWRKSFGISNPLPIRSRKYT
jgi:sugar lactone lactonase YvrE